MTQTAALQDLPPQAPADAAHWQQATTEALVAHLLERYHRPLGPMLEQLDALAVRVLEVHGAQESERLGRLLQTLRVLQRVLGPHLCKEERVLFPWLLARRSPPPVVPIQVLQMEHAQLDECLAGLRQLTGGYVAPPGACRTWRTLWEGLATLERELTEHAWLEDEVLFPRGREVPGYGAPASAAVAAGARQSPAR